MRIDSPFQLERGAPPPELAGRAPVLDALASAVRAVGTAGGGGRAQPSGLPAAPIALVGVRGVGRSTLLGTLAARAEELATTIVRPERGATVGATLAAHPDLLDHERTRERGVTFLLHGTARDLVPWLEFGHHARQARLPVAFVLDTGTELASTIRASPRAVAWPDIMLLGPLTERAVHDAIAQPAERLGRTFTADAAAAIHHASGGFPDRVQVYADRAWRITDDEAIGDDAVAAAIRFVDARDRPHNVRRIGRFNATVQALRPSARRTLRALTELRGNWHSRTDLLQHRNAKYAGARATTREQYAGVNDSRFLADLAMLELAGLVEGSRRTIRPTHRDIAWVTGARRPPTKQRDHALDVGRGHER